MIVNNSEIYQDKTPKYQYFDRALSWLSFNNDVLLEATNKNLPIYDRIKFLAVHQSNLDKFFQTGVATYRTMLNLSRKAKQKLDFSPKELLNKIDIEVKRQENEFEKIFESTVLTDLYDHHVVLIQDLNLSKDQIEYTRHFFNSEILPFIQPIIPAKSDLFNIIKDDAVHLLVPLHKKKGVNDDNQSDNSKNTFAIIKVQSDKLPRFVLLPKSDEKHYIIFIDDIIRTFLQTLLPQYHVENAYSLTLSQNPRLKLEDELKKKYAEDLHIKLTRQKTKLPVLLQYDRNMPDNFVKILKNSLNLPKKAMRPVFRYHKLSDLLLLPNPYKPYLESENLPAIRHSVIDQAPSMYKATKKNDILFHFPYHSFDYIIRLFNEAAVDPKVEEIKITQYKIEDNSALVSALISAALNGKKVSVYVDFKAQFNESASLKFTEQLTEAGIHIVPSIAGHKIYAKAALIIRRKSKKGKQRCSGYISTGNFNKKTSQEYCDHGLLTSNNQIVEDLKSLFLFLEKPQGILNLNQLIVPKFNFRQFFKTIVDHEIKNAKEGKRAFIILKANNLVDKKIINQLYEASINGVAVELIIRASCCLITGKSFSQNIHVTRIIDKYLEHSCILLFYNEGLLNLYITSTDMVKANIERRIDLVVPILNGQIKDELIHTLQIQLKTSSNFHILEKSNGANENNSKSQQKIYQYLKQLYQ